MSGKSKLGQFLGFGCLFLVILIVGSGLYGFYRFKELAGGAECTRNLEAVYNAEIDLVKTNNIKTDAEFKAALGDPPYPSLRIVYNGRVNSNVETCKCPAGGKYTVPSKLDPKTGMPEKPYCSYRLEHKSGLSQTRLHSIDILP